MSEKVSVIIPSYNRFKYLLNAIESVKNQTYKNIEIIVINDCSTQKEYYEYDFTGITIIHLDRNTKEVLGFGCAAYVRNIGIKVSTGEYIAFLDDDDIWFPYKIDHQLYCMKNSGCKMSCTDGFIGNGVFQKSIPYPKYNGEFYFNDIKSKYANSQYFQKDFPNIWTLDFLKIHNCCITSSVIVEKSILNQIGSMKHVNKSEDYEYWLRILQHTNCVYVKYVCFYYDINHGEGQKYL
jgi:glycosyltransferase involved in cell wall biosynthesis